MAIYHFSATIVKRSAGRSSVAAAAYRAGELIKNDRDGVTHNYRRRDDVVHNEIMLPEHAPLEYADRATLWNVVELGEKRKDAQTARELNIALPREFDLGENVDIMREYVNENFVTQGMIADFAVHDNHTGNPHAHVMLTMREVSEYGFGKKNRDWNDTALLENWRENWARTCNERLVKHGISDRIDHRTLAEQGIIHEPTIHLGAAYALSQRGILCDRADIQAEISRNNATKTPDFTAEFMGELLTAHAALNREISDIKSRWEHPDNLSQLEQYRAEVVREYQTQLAMLDLRADAPEIRHAMKQAAPTAPREAIARARSENALKRIDESTLREIVKSLPQRLHRMIDRVRDFFSRDHGQERIRERERER